MIDAALFPPHWLTETDDSALWWFCPFSRPDEVEVAAKFVVLLPEPFPPHLDLFDLSREPTANGSHLIVDGEGVTMHLTQPDKAIMAGMPVVFALTVKAAGQVDEAGGQLIVSDWAVTPHQGTA